MRRTTLLIALIFLHFGMFSQENKEKNYNFGGYISQMNQVLIDSITGDWTADGSINNRLKFNYFGVKNLNFDFGIRNRIIYGETVKMLPAYAQNFDKDNGFIDLSWNLASEKSFIVNSAIDRLNFSYEANKFKVTIGRQRINWGKTFVWNPNDLFNNYSFFDFDYVEKPGADAIYLQYFRNYASSVEFAAKINSDTNVTAAVKYGFNFSNYDFQVISGILEENDFSAGLGWSGYIKQVTFRGEATYLQPIKNFTDTAGVLIASIGFDYMFQNSLSIIGEFLYNQQPPTFNLLNINQIQNAPMNVKSLSFAKYNAFLQVSYPLTPLINISLASMYMDTDEIFFFSPNISFSLSQNVDFTVIGQFFTGKFQNPVTLQNERRFISLIFMRLKYSF